ncbi:hypothetical protein CFH99_17170 [Nocardioides aromaticivorans]|uniref:PH domain-containing protein n=1 Tax=Nocardioides aromaticivorans TaxID=200618 RepID=A0ABX7PP13_9ACTN|nr:hypothetical protein [Nocardioides aromaticivorans]QSR27355.1 hypothetical protein CFH99_17170 [Nocardioides aromaticivorans]
MTERLVVRNSAINWGTHLLLGAAFIALGSLTDVNPVLALLPGSILLIRGVRLAIRPVLVVTPSVVEVRDGYFFAGARRVRVDGFDDLVVDGTRFRRKDAPTWDDIIRLDWRSGGRRDDLIAVRDALQGRREGPA